jgi:dienelactone hydrolase
MAKPGRRALFPAGILLAVILCTGYVRYYDVIHVVPASFAETQSVILPYLQVLLPEADGPRPAVLLFHGCGGVKPSLYRRAREFVALGYAAVIVDSYKGRNIDWEKVCDGRQLFGDQRAADVLVALDFARHHAGIAGDQLFLAGYSHGGWAVLETLAYNGALPRGLADSPPEPLAGVRGVIAWYPYCGVATHFRNGWTSDIPVLMLLAAEDEITAPGPCMEVARREADAGRPVQWRLFANVSHGFDTLEEWVERYDAGVHAAARGLQEEFLAQHSR